MNHLTSSVIYRNPCLCDALYIGETDHSIVFMNINFVWKRLSSHIRPTVPPHSLILKLQFSYWPATISLCLSWMNRISSNWPFPIPFHSNGIELESLAPVLLELQATYCLHHDIFAYGLAIRLRYNAPTITTAFDWERLAHNFSWRSPFSIAGQKSWFNIVSIMT